MRCRIYLSNYSLFITPFSLIPTATGWYLSSSQPNFPNTRTMRCSSKYYIFLWYLSFDIVLNWKKGESASPKSFLPPMHFYVVLDLVAQRPRLGMVVSKKETQGRPPWRPSFPSRYRQDLSQFIMWHIWSSWITRFPSTFCTNPSSTIEFYQTSNHNLRFAYVLHLRRLSSTGY